MDLITLTMQLLGGALAGYRWGLERKAALLEGEARRRGSGASRAPQAAAAEDKRADMDDAA